MFQDLSAARYLPSFLAVCNEGTLARAAIYMNKTQPAISYDLRRLEETFKLRLFERSGRRLIITPAGRRLRELGDAYLRSFATFRHGQDADGVDVPPIRIAAVSSFVRPSHRAGRADSIGKGIRLSSCCFGTAAEVFRLVETGEVTLGAVYHPKTSNLLHFRLLYREELVLIGPAGPSRVRWANLDTYAALPFVTYEESEYDFGKWFHDHFGRQPLGGVSHCHFTELEEVVDAVAHGLGLSIVPADRRARHIAAAAHHQAEGASMPQRCVWCQPREYGQRSHVGPTLPKRLIRSIHSSTVSDASPHSKRRASPSTTAPTPSERTGQRPNRP